MTDSPLMAVVDGSRDGKNTRHRSIAYGVVLSDDRQLRGFRRWTTVMTSTQSERLAIAQAVAAGAERVVTDCKTILGLARADHTGVDIIWAPRCSDAASDHADRLARRAKHDSHHGRFQRMGSHDWEPAIIEYPARDDIDWGYWRSIFATRSEAGHA